MAKKGSKYDIIWATVKQIPRGRVASYGNIAALSGLEGQQRLVGYALHNLPRNSGVPWHRIINSQGRISLPKNTGGYRRQKKLLEKEGIVFEKEKVDMKRFGIMTWLEKGTR